MLIPGQYDHIHHLGQPWPCHFRKIGSAKTAALMTLLWGGSSFPQRSPCLVACCKREEGWARRNYYVTCRPRQCHYIHCPCTSPSGVGASRAHGSTRRRASVSSRLRRKRGGTSCPSFPKLITASYWSTNFHGSTTRRATRLNILLFFQLIFDISYDTFWWSVLTYGMYCLFYSFFVP